MGLIPRPTGEGEQESGEDRVRVEEEKRCGRLVRAAETTRELAEWSNL